MHNQVSQGLRGGEQTLGSGRADVLNVLPPANARALLLRQAIPAFDREVNRTDPHLASAATGSQVSLNENIAVSSAVQPYTAAQHTGAPIPSSPEVLQYAAPQQAQQTQGV